MISEKRNHPDEAIILLDELVRDNPSYAEGYRMLAEMYGSTRRDSLKATQYLERYNRFLHEGAK